jgi:hypothetical protein
MSTLYMIQDDRTVYCRVEMKANGGSWNPVTGAWMFAHSDDQANALSDLYRATRPTLAMREALTEMIADGTGALGWGFDPMERPVIVSQLDRAEASKMLAAGYAVRRVLGVHPLEDVEEPPLDTVFDASEFEMRAEARQQRRRRSAA